MAAVEGVGARQAALKMLDSVLRQGRTLDAAAQESRGLAPADQGLAIAIAGEALRRLPDLDALIDGATPRPLPGDSKARMVLRLALAQKQGGVSLAPRHVRLKETAAVPGLVGFGEGGWWVQDLAASLPARPA